MPHGWADGTEEEIKLTESCTTFDKLASQFRFVSSAPLSLQVSPAHLELER